MRSLNNKIINNRMLRRSNALLLGQGAFYMATGLWPLLNIRSFEKITGPKTDRWLVKTAGVLVTAIGSTLTIAGVRKSRGIEIPILAIGSAIGLTAIDVNYAAKRRISKVYLLDAIAEVALVGCWIFASLKKTPGKHSEA
jgi:hypothetical protein